MKVIVREKVNHIATPQVKTFKITVDAVNNTGRIPSSIGLMKGDIIVFRGEGDPVRFSAGTASGKVLMTDPTTETGWILGNGGGGGDSLVTLHNSTNEIILAGTVVRIDSGINFVKATASDTSALFVVSEECSPNEDVDCYSIRNTICMVLCTSDAVTIGDSLCISSTAGVLEKRTDSTKREVAVALSAKTSGSTTGLVKALLSDVNPYAVLEVKDGGTGATTASGARTNLGAASAVDLNNKILYFTSQAVSAVWNDEMFRITDDAVSTDTVVLGCTFADANVKGDVTWQSYDGYVAFVGTCVSDTTANVILGTKGE